MCMDWLKEKRVKAALPVFALPCLNSSKSDGYITPKLYEQPIASTVHKEPVAPTTHAQPLSCLRACLRVGQHAKDEELKLS